MKKRILYLHIKGKYFEQIKSGKKSEEYRLFNNFWCARLDMRTFDEVHILKGYPKKSDLTRRLVFP
jgi:ASC-1-like (ASCH) protein